ncbi:MAG: FeoB-associated Cys-rich membrane protein [Lachnospiraceae bacterium]|nr:FeoB-associated Cys-rich membrane protein [Lachnospiraceae bacterium]
MLYENLATVLIGMALLGLVILAVRSIWRDKKQGKACGSCGGNCSGCHGCSISRGREKVSQSGNRKQ